MKPIDIRNANWADLRGELSGRLEQVFEAWLVHGPCTTRQLAAQSGIDILNVRPRTTDLCTVGLVECIGQADGEGIYAVRSMGDWEVWRSRQPSVEVSGQQVLI